MSNPLKSHFLIKLVLLKKTLFELVSAALFAGTSLFFGGCSTPKKVDFEAYKQNLPDCAILVSEPRDWYEHLRLPFEFIYECAVASALKEKLEIKGYTVTFNARWEDLERVLSDDSIQTIVVAGHGKWYEWHASDRTVTDGMIAKFMKFNNIKKKRGFFIRHTCGSRRYAFGGLLISDAERINLTKLLESYGAKNVVLDLTLNDDDENFGRKRNRIKYSLSQTADKKYLENIVDLWNNRFDMSVKSNEVHPLGSSVVDNPSKTRGYEGIVGPIDYIFSPIPDEQASAGSNSLGL